MDNIHIPQSSCPLFFSLILHFSPRQHYSVNCIQVVFGDNAQNSHPAVVPQISNCLLGIYFTCFSSKQSWTYLLSQTLACSNAPLLSSLKRKPGNQSDSPTTLSEAGFPKGRTWEEASFLQAIYWQSALQRWELRKLGGQRKELNQNMVSAGDQLQMASQGALEYREQGNADPTSGLWDKTSVPSHRLVIGYKLPVGRGWHNLLNEIAPIQTEPVLQRSGHWGIRSQHKQKLEDE